MEEFATDTQPQQRFLVLQAAACEYSRLSRYHPVGEESGETKGCIGKLNKLYNFDVSHPYRIGLNVGGPSSSQQETRELNSSWGIRCKDKDTKDEQEWPSLLIPIERRHHGTPLHKNRTCFPTKQWISVLPYWYKIQETAYCVAGGNQDHHPDRQ